MNETTEKNTVVRTFPITDNDVDFRKRYDVCSLMRHFHSVADDHAYMLGVDATTIWNAYSAIWVISRIRVDMARMPEWHGSVRVETWPMPPGIVRMDREATLSDESGEFARLSSEWCVLDKATGKPRRPAQAGYPVDMPHRSERGAGEYERFAPVYDPSDALFDHTVRVSDLDMNVHMNNVAYLRLACDAFSVRETERMRIRSFEIIFKAQSFEGDRLTVYRKDEDGRTYVSAFKSDGTRVFDVAFDIDRAA